MASVGDTQMRKQLRVCRRRQKRHLKLKRGSRLSSNRNNSFNSIADSEEVYVVESIRDERIIKGQKYYKVRWHGFPPEADSWEPEQNLTNLLDIIASFHRSKAKTPKNLDVQKEYQPGYENSPASLPTPPSTPSTAVHHLHGRLRGASEERQVNNSIKRKHCTKSRTSGRYEYVPKHQLVALKTKYFDDIRDGKIDLCSNDLYSRVKTRKRCAAESTSNSVSNESAQSRGGSLHGENESECDASMETFASCFPKREPVSPSFSCFGNSECFPDSNCTLETNEQEHTSVYAADNSDHLSGINNNMVGSFDERLHDIDRTSNTDNKAVQSDILNSESKSISCDLGFYNSLNKVDVGLSPISVSPLDDEALQKSEQEVTPTSAIKEQIEQLHNTNNHSQGRSVPSLRTLVNIYFNLILSHISNQDQVVQGEQLNDFQNELESLPYICVYNPQTSISTSEELLEAINNQRWSLIATTPSEKLFSVPDHRQKNVLSPESSLRTHDDRSDFKDLCFNEDILLACITGGAGRPLVLDRLLTSGLDPNKVTEPNSKWPLLALAVSLGRLHAAQALLDAGANPNCVEPNCRQRSALGLAIAAGDVDMANMLILSGANFYEVEPGSTALALIMRLLNAHVSAQSNTKTNYGQLNKSYLALTELQDKLQSPDNHHPPVPPPCPPNGLDVYSLPKPYIFNALINSSFGNHYSSDQSSNTDFNNSKSGNILPSVDSLRRLHELVVAHHARLSLGVTNLVRNWLTRADLVQVGLVSPCQWINIRECSATIKFSWPNKFTKPKSESSRLVAPILILVHGRITPPACYDVWMDDDGPCVIERVCLDQMYTQRPLNRMLFVTTLYPLDWKSSKPREHEVLIEFKQDHILYRQSTRPTCIAIMIVAVALSHNNSKEGVSQRNGNSNTVHSSRSASSNNNNNNKTT
uniref:Chromo domain-containing protein n=1 Tax=Trichobilharzia regenti TaxID=157069 RepID=A0AA85JUA4_TRIRE|nr:unnamed protein product [Trichobilharzia regenti]